MHRFLPIAAAAVVLAGAGPALAQFGSGGSSGGDREPAGGAFMSSYTYPGSTGVQAGGPPRSVDIPRGYNQQGAYTPYGRAPRSYRQPGW